ncbi:MAG TPA: HEAT repeat domain-containing protein [Chloroflexia bacterium]|jgi:hypothetical protein
MNKRLEELLAELQQLSPMPDDDVVIQEQLDAYNRVIHGLYEVLQQDKDPRAIQPLIASFGYIDGFDLYQTTGTTLRLFDVEQLMPHLLDAVQHGERGQRAWAAELLGDIGDRAAVPHLLPLLSDPAEYVRARAAFALGMIGDPATREAIEQLQNYPSEEVRDAVEIALENFGNAGAYRNIIDIEHYFMSNNFMESLVLEYVYDPSAEMVTVTCDYAYDAVLAVLQREKPPLMQGNKGYHREFRRLIFLGIHGYERKVGTSKSLRLHQDNYSAKLHERSVTIQGLIVRRNLRGDALKAQIDLGDFGSCTLSFTSLQVDRKFARSTGKRPDSEEWDYTDIDTLEPIDFYSPFAKS